MSCWNKGKVMRVVCVLVAFCFSIIVISDSCFGQERDPFGSGPSKPATSQQQKPDAENQARAKDIAEQLAREELLDKMDRRQLRIELNEVKANANARLDQASKNLASTRNTLNNLQAKLAETQSELKLRRANAELRDELESALINRLLTSEKVSDQLIALNFMMEYQDRAMAAKANCVPVTTMLLTQLVTLIDSKNQEVHNKAVWFLMRVHPDLAAEVGYQPKSGYWKAVNQTGRFHDYSRHHRCFFEYESVPLFDVIDETAQNYGIEIVLDPTVDQELIITFAARDMPLRDGLQLLMEKYELTYRVLDDAIVIYRAGDPKAKSIETYCVRGILANEMSIDDIAELLSEQVGKSGKVKKLDKHRVTVIADSLVQDQVSKVLGALAK